MQTPPTCMWRRGLSLVRNETSSALSRSMCPCAMAEPTRLPADAPSSPSLVARSRSSARGLRRRATSPRSGRDGAFDAERAFADLEAQVEIGPRPRGSRGERELTASLIAASLVEAGVEDVDDPATRSERRRDAPRARSRAPSSSAPTTTPRTDPGLRGRQRRRLRRRGRARAGALAAEAAAGPVDRSSSLFDAEEARGDRPFELDGTRGSRQYVELRRAAAAPGRRRRSTRSARWSSSTWSATATSRSRCEASSDPALYELFAEAARERTGSPAPFEGSAAPIADDHIPFLEAGIPAST